MDAKKVRDQKQLRKVGEQQFGYMLTDNEGWIFKGDELHLCAIEIYRVMRERRAEIERRIAAGQNEFPKEDYGLIRLSSCGATVCLLIGFALENYLKGAWVKLNPAPDGNARDLPLQFKEKKTAHNLLAHAKAIGLVLDPEEERTLSILTEHAVWRGRYPVALNASLTGESFANQGSLSVILDDDTEDGWRPPLKRILHKLGHILRPDDFP